MPVPEAEPKVLESSAIPPFPSGIGGVMLWARTQVLGEVLGGGCKYVRLIFIKLFHT